MNSESKQEISMDELITKRTVTLTQISDINDKIRKTDYNKLEDNIKSEMSSYIEKSKRNSLGEKRLEIKIRLIKERLETMRETIDIQNNEQMKYTRRRVTFIRYKTTTSSRGISLFYIKTPREDCYRLFK